MDFNSRNLESLFDLTQLVKDEYNLDLRNFIPQLSMWNATRGIVIIPRWLRRFMLNLLNPTLSQNVINLSMGSGAFLIDSIKHVFGNRIENINNFEEIKLIRNYIHSKLYATEENRELAQLAKVNFLLSFGVDFDVISPKLLPSSDIVIMSRPLTYNLHVTVGSNFRSNIDLQGFNELQLGLSSLRTGGCMAIIVPEVFMFSTTIEGLRKFLVKRRFLKAIISLPYGLFGSYATLKLNLIIFKKRGLISADYDPSILMLDANSIDDESVGSILHEFKEKYRTGDFASANKPIFAKSHSNLKSNWSLKVNDAENITG